MSEAIGAAYLADAGFEPELAEELRRAGRRIARWHGQLALSPDAPVGAAWSLDTWTAPQLIEIGSIKTAAAALRAIQRNWSLYGVLHHRRAALIQDALPPVKAKPLAFPEPAPTGHLGAWTLLEPGLMLASATKTSPFVNGQVALIEDKEGPPSRAYLKLWEGFTRLGVYPGPGEVCMDLGACPGGWTWVLASLGARVIAVDKAPLDAGVLAMPGVTVRQESAFGLEPAKEEPVDWLLSDIICYPARLLGLVNRWRAAGKARNYLCTIKFQGATDHDVVAEFAAIPGARIFHASHNKHELTFALLDQPV